MGKIIHDVENLQNGEFATVEKCPGLRGFQPVTFGALSIVLLDTLTIVAVTALFALIAILPLQGCQVAHKAILIRKPLLKLFQDWEAVDCGDMNMN